MLVSKATRVLLRNSLWKTENVSLGIISCHHNNSIKELYLVQKRYKKTSSDDCDEKKRCHEPKKSRAFVKLATVAVIGTTVAVIAAKYDDDFRDWSKEHIPTLDSLVKIVFQEEDTYLESLDKAHKNISAWIKKKLHDIYKATQSKPSISSSSPIDKIGTLPTLEPCDESTKPYKPPESAFVIKGDDDKKEESSKGGKVSKELKDLKALEDKLVKTAKDTIRSLGITECSLRDFAKLIDYLDTIIHTNNKRAWDKIAKLGHDATKEEEKAKVNLVNFKALEKQLKEKLRDDPNLSDDDGKAKSLNNLKTEKSNVNLVNFKAKGDDPNLSDDVKAKALNNLNTLSKDVDNAKAKLEKTKKNTLAKRNWDKVKQARLHFSESLETLFPNVWLNDEKLNIPVDQLDPFTENVLGDIDYYGRQNAKHKGVILPNLDAAAEKYKDKGSEAVDDFVDILLPHEVAKEKRKNEEELQKKLLAHKAKCGKVTKDLMKQTKELYADLTAEALKVKEKEVERKMQQQLEEKLADLRAQHKIEIAKMVGRMEGANEAIAKRGEKDVKQQSKQQFWSAAQSFMAAVKPLGSAEAEPKPLKSEITNLTKVKPEGDELVESVLSSIPPQAVEKGVPTEACLREKFIKVMRTAQGWAGVPDGEISIPQLLLARVQSALYWNVAIPKAELDNEPAIDPEKLNNYDVLNRAKYYVDRGEYDQAIKYLNLLKGPSSKVASDWTKDALVYLETRQAAEVLLAHATAAGMAP